MVEYASELTVFCQSSEIAGRSIGVKGAAVQRAGS